jgi:uncharacterized protein (DUF2267 family)
MRAHDFVTTVAEREGTTVDQALLHARAVFVTLREVLDEEFFDVRVHLPTDYDVLLRPMVTPGSATARHR